MTQKASAVVVAVHPQSATSPASVDVDMLGGWTPGVRFPPWYTPQVNDVVIVEWIGSQPYVSIAFF